MASRLDAPEGVEVQDLGDRLWITRRWFYWTSLPLGLFALAWLGLTLCKYADNLFNVCNLFFLGLGLLMLYTAVLSLTNRTEIEVDRQVLTIEHGPLPRFRRDKTIPTRDIDRLFVKTIRTSGNLTGTSRSWSLYMVDRFGDKRELLRAMPDWNQAQYIKQEIDRFLCRIRSEEEEKAGMGDREGAASNTRSGPLLSSTL
ncbi:MAG: hypothetical protein PVF47_15940 [Anaerolineae bacterium]